MKCQLILENITTKFKIYKEEIEVNMDNILFYSVELDIRDLQDGEYQISIYDKTNKLLGEDIVRIGEFKTKNNAYKIERKFKTYDRK